MPDTSPTLKIALIGYGVMGRLIESLADQHNCQVTAIFDANHGEKQSVQDFAQNFGRDTEQDPERHFDVAIDFSLPHAVLDNVAGLAQLGYPMVIGTTGWDAQRGEIEKLVRAANLGCIYGSNFSIGMNMFFEIVRQASSLAERHEDYDLMLHEFHHRRKADSPSGTANELARIVLEQIERKQSVQGERCDGPIGASELHVSSTRGGDIPGTHTLIIDSAADSIELTHRARNREGFAHGALRAARWISGKTGFHDFSQIFTQL